MKHLRFAAVALAGLSVLSSCNSNPAGPGPSRAAFEVSACSGQTFNIRLVDPGLIARANELIGESNQPIVNGRLVRGNGGFNGPWSWHLAPESIEFADVTVEVCDGCPQMVEGDLDYWVDTVGRFCPWTSRVVRRLR